MLPPEIHATEPTWIAMCPCIQDFQRLGSNGNGDAVVATEGSSASVTCARRAHHARRFGFFMMKTSGIITRNSRPSSRKIWTNATIAACRCTMPFSAI